MSTLKNFKPNTIGKQTRKQRKRIWNSLAAKGIDHTNLHHQIEKAIANQVDGNAILENASDSIAE